MENLQMLLEILRKEERKFKGTYYIPECWNNFGFDEFSINLEDVKRRNQINVNPYHFFSSAINECMKNKDFEYNALKALDIPLEITQSVIYSMFPRMFTSWNHYDEDHCGGTFLKAICMLPYLKSLRVNVIYLLPVFKYSDISKKGEIGSPYAIKNIYAIDENLHDDLLGKDKKLVNIEFKAFVEACHLLDIRVMVDFVFRTVSRDNDLMVDHPDWFYWIGKEYESEFEVPKLEGFSKPTVVSEKAIEKIYKSEKLKDYLRWFRPSPDKIDDYKWKRIKARHLSTGENILKLIEETFGTTTAPAFSDVINDLQPAWTDVTYIKIFHDLHKIAKEYVGKTQSPYILYDIAKASVARGERPNEELWEYIASVMPYYQNEFGIDGARIDMGHALPDELNREMVDRVRENNPNFILWSEEFNAKNSESPKNNGFSFMTGGLWMTYREFEDKDFYGKLMEELDDAKIPVSAALETPDTPRGAYLYSQKGELELMMAVNLLIPNSVPFINNGMEVMETQPMNLGLGNTEKGRFVLSEDDPMYGKLAFFDNYMIHWTNKGHDFIARLMNDIGIIKDKYAFLMNTGNLINIDKLSNNSELFVLLYFDKNTGNGLFLIANKSRESSAEFVLREIIPEYVMKNSVRVLYKEGKLCVEKIEINTRIKLDTKEYIIGGIGDD